MLAIENEVLFLCFCVEIYKAEKGWSGQDTFNYLYRTGATGFIKSSYEGLHMTGHLYIVDCIDEYISNNAHYWRS